jgi:hypothetical protein
MAVRFGLVGLALVFGLAGSPLASAQTAGTGTLVGRVVLCRFVPPRLGIADRNPGPVIDAPPRTDDRVPLSAGPAADVQVSMDGTQVTARTDAAGAFSLQGVPASQPFTLLAQLAAGPPLVLETPDVMVAPGQTLDLGTLAPIPCNGRPGILLPRPPVLITARPDADLDIAPQPDVPPASPVDNPLDETDAPAD